MITVGIMKYEVSVLGIRILRKEETRERKGIDAKGVRITV